MLCMPQPNSTWIVDARAGALRCLSFLRSETFYGNVNLHFFNVFEDIFSLSVLKCNAAFMT